MPINCTFPITFSTLCYKWLTTQLITVFNTSLQNAKRIHQFTVCNVHQSLSWCLSNKQSFKVLQNTSVIKSKVLPGRSLKGEMGQAVSSFCNGQSNEGTLVWWRGQSNYRTSLVSSPNFDSDFCLDWKLGPCDIRGRGQNHRLPPHEMVRHQSECRIIHLIITASIAHQHVAAVNGCKQTASGARSSLELQAIWLRMP